jgi:hypothetical protein
LTRTAAKQREACLLASILGDEVALSATPSERPDFIVTEPAGNRFGFEITEVYMSETNARAKNIQNYVSSLFTGGHHIHRDDASILKVQDAMYSKPGNTESYPVKIIRQDYPAITDYVELIINRIENKDARADGYDASLSHINLLIFDGENRFAQLDSPALSRAVIPSRMRQVLWKSVFREVYFVTRVTEGKSVYVPLVWLTALSELYFFIDVLKRHYHACALTNDNIMHMFAKVLDRKGSWPARIKFDDDCTKIYYRGYIFYIASQDTINTIGHGDSRAPEGLESPKTRQIEAFPWRSFSQRFRHSYLTNRFVCGYFAFDTKFDVSDRLKALMPSLA